jgi:hypothetical protein
MVVWFTTTYVIYYWNTKGGCDCDHLVVWLTTTYVMYYWNTHHMITTTADSCISVIYYRCSCKSHHHMITTTTASCISVIHDICSCKSHLHIMYYLSLYFGYCIISLFFWLLYYLSLFPLAIVLSPFPFGYCVICLFSINGFWLGTVVMVIVWWLDLQLHKQSIPITTYVVISNPAQVHRKIRAVL